jgi:carboxypeptidase Taq
MNQHLKRLHDLDGECRLLAHTADILNWDQETYMPEKAVEERSEQLALLQGLLHDRQTSAEIGDLLSALGSTQGTPAGDPGLPPVERDFLRALWRDYSKNTKLPRDLVTEFARETVVSQSVWQEARKRSDFALFKPHLARIVELSRQVGAAYGFADRPYDGLLDDYEPGNGQEKLDAVFGALRTDLVVLLGKISSRPRVRDDFLSRPFPIAGQDAFARRVAADIGYDFGRGRLDLTAHPFTTTLGSDDVRITTRYDERAMAGGLFSVIHEAGHGLYEQGFDPEIRGSLLADGTSMGIHESQSRFWENVIGRSLPFWSHYFPILKDAFPSQLADVGLEEFYRAINAVTPSLIRTESDEVTYGLHIILRYRLEKELIGGTLSVEDAPAAWNAAMRELLGVEVPDDASGILQDVHWAGGLFGYFPSYALGNLYGAQFYATMRRDLPALDSDVASGRFSPSLGWLRDRIHRFGRRCEPGEICERVTGGPLEARFFVDYLNAKYRDIYGF